MKLLVRHCMLIFLLFPALNGSAQHQQVKFIQVTSTNGVSLGKINAIIRDKYGYIYTVRALYEDKSGRLWVGTNEVMA